MAEGVEFEADVLRVIDGDSIIVKNEDGKLLIPGDILAALTVVRDSGLVNMASLRDIKELVPTEVGTWLDENKDTYMEGFFYGFADDGTKYMETV